MAKIYQVSIDKLIVVSPGDTNAPDSTASRQSSGGRFPSLTKSLEAVVEDAVSQGLIDDAISAVATESVASVKNEETAATAPPPTRLEQSTSSASSSDAASIKSTRFPSATAAASSDNDVNESFKKEQPQPQPQHQRATIADRQQSEQRRRPPPTDMMSILSSTS